MLYPPAADDFVETTKPRNAAKDLRAAPTARG